MEEQETLFVRSAHRMHRESRAMLACGVTKLGLKVIVSNCFHKKGLSSKEICDGVQMSHFDHAK